MGRQWRALSPPNKNFIYFFVGVAVEPWLLGFQIFHLGGEILHWEDQQAVLPRRKDEILQQAENFLQEESNGDRLLSLNHQFSDTNFQMLVPAPDQRAPTP